MAMFQPLYEAVVAFLKEVGRGPCFQYCRMRHPSPDARSPYIICRTFSQGDMYADATMSSGRRSLPWFTALSAFWPGLQVLYGDVTSASRTMVIFSDIWRRYGFVPEAFDIAANKIPDKCVMRHGRPRQCSG